MKRGDCSSASSNSGLDASAPMRSKDQTKVISPESEKNQSAYSSVVPRHSLSFPEIQSHLYPELCPTVIQGLNQAGQMSAVSFVDDTKHDKTPEKPVSKTIIKKIIIQRKLHGLQVEMHYRLI